MLATSFRRHALRALAALALISQQACFWSDDEPEPVVETAAKSEPSGMTKGKVAKASGSETDLKLAKLWARVDEMEEQQSRLREKVKVLEKGFTLGLIPEELKDEPGAGPKASAAKESMVAGSPKAKEKMEPVDLTVELEPLAAKAAEKAAKNGNDSMEKAGKGLAPEDQDEYQKMVASAHEQFRAGRYGRAIVEYTEIGKKFGEAVEGGAHRFWIAKSWSALKELNPAKQNFQEFLEAYPTSPWAPRAKLELARVEWRLGLQDSAVKRLRDIIEKHPYEDAAEMAKMELEQLEKSL